MLRASPCDVDPCGHTGNGGSQTTCPETGEANCIWFRRNIKQGVLFEMVSIFVIWCHGLSTTRAFHLAKGCFRPVDLDVRRREEWWGAARNNFGCYSYWNADHRLSTSAPAYTPLRRWSREGNGCGVRGSAARVALDNYSIPLKHHNCTV